MPIQGFSCKATESFFLEGKGHHKQGWSKLAGAAARKLDFLDAATVLNDLASSPGNRLESLSGDLEGFWSIRVNNQWRIIFTWIDDLGPDQVAIVDYH